MIDWYSKYIHEKLIRLAIPDFKEEELDQIVYHYERCNPLDIQRLKNVARKKYHYYEHREKFEEIYIELAKEIINADDPTNVIVKTFKNYNISMVLRVCAEQHVSLIHQLRSISKELWKKSVNYYTMREIRKSIGRREDKVTKERYHKDNPHHFWTIKKLKEELDRMGVEYKKSVKKAELVSLYEEHEKVNISQN